MAEEPTLEKAAVATVADAAEGDYVKMMDENKAEGVVGDIIEETADEDSGPRPRRRQGRVSLLFRGSLRQSMRRLSSIRRSSALQEPLTTTEGGTKDDNQGPPQKTTDRWLSGAFWLEAVLYLYSMALLVFSIALIVGCIWTQQTSGTAPDPDGLGLPPLVVLTILVLLLAWLAVMEGGQGALVGLKPIEKDLYQQSHVVTSRITNLVYNPETTMERFIVGRQFLVVLVVFGINNMAATLSQATLWDLNDVVTDVVLESGLALILITLILGQLVAQVNAADCMLDFINNYIMLGTTYLALGLETLGLLHCTYLVQMVFSQKKKKNDNDKNEISTGERIFFWLRVFLSLTLLGFAMAVTLSALFHGQTTSWEGLPNIVSVLVFFGLMGLVGMMEGMQIALFAVINMSEAKLQRESPVAYGNCRAIFGREDAMQAFLIGRQICVTVCTFLIARITTIRVEDDDNNDEEQENIFGVPDSLQTFFNTGLLGAVITTIVASLVWRIIASSFPMAFLSNPLVAVLIRICLLLERSGICSAAWVLARLVKAIMKYEPDEVYLDVAEPTHGIEPVTERDEDIDRLFMRSSITSLQIDLAAHGLA